MLLTAHGCAVLPFVPLLPRPTRLSLFLSLSLTRFLTPAAPVLQNLDDYLALVGNMYYQSPEVGRSNGGFSLIRRTTLGMLTAPVREPSVLDKWSPYEIALFESSICLVGKLFHQIAANIKTKTTGEVIEFYYVWKKSKNYAAWKATYRHLVLLD